MAGDAVVQELNVARLHPRVQRERHRRFPWQVERGALLGREARYIREAPRGFDVAAAVLAGEAAPVQTLAPVRGGRAMVQRVATRASTWSTKSVALPR